MTLPLEFSRISESREDALTLVIDDHHGTECTVKYTKCRRERLEDAIADLRCREGTAKRHIGHWSMQGNKSNHPFCNRIGEWAQRAEFDSIVWTALPSNYREKKNEEFSVKSGIQHLKGLSEEGKHKASPEIPRKRNRLTP